jgi:hypothetical protein
VPKDPAAYSVEILVEDLRGLMTEGAQAKARNFADAPTRRGFAQKDPRGWAEFLRNVLDHSGVGSALMTRGVIPHAGLLMVPMTGHTVNTEEPSLFNESVAEFFAGVESGRWGTWSRKAR